MSTPLTISEVSRRRGVAASALRFYEERGLITSERAGSGHRRYPRAVLRRIACIVFAQCVGLSLEEIGAELAKLPPHHVPTRRDWSRLSRGWTSRIDRRIAELERLKVGLTEGRRSRRPPRERDLGHDRCRLATAVRRTSDHEGDRRPIAHRLVHRGLHPQPEGARPDDRHALVHPYTFRNENASLPRQLRSSEDPAAYGDGFGEYATFYGLGVEWLFSDHPDTAVEALRAGSPRTRQVAGSRLRRATTRIDCAHDSRTSHRRTGPGRDPMMFDGLLYPLRLPERALVALGRIVEDLSGLRAELAGGLGTLEQTVDSLAADVHPMRTDVAVVRDSTSRLPEGMAKLEQAVTGLGAKLEQVQDGVGTLHADMTELCAHVEGLGRQLDTMQQTVNTIHHNVDEVARDLPGASGTGAIAKVREAVGRGSS